MLDIVIDHDSVIAPFEQLRRRIIDLVRSGELIAGTKLPTVRSCAADLGIAPNTVARTYRELEHLGVLETRGRAGTFIADTGDPTRTLAQRAATAYAAEIRNLGVGDQDALDFVRVALRGS